MNVIIILTLESMLSQNPDFAEHPVIARLKRQNGC